MRQRRSIAVVGLIAFLSMTAVIERSMAVEPASVQREQESDVRRSKFEDEVRYGQKYLREIRPGLFFILQPVPEGWWIMVNDDPDSRDNFAGPVTTPLHGLTALDILGWVFPNEFNDQQPYNAPQKIREFSFTTSRTDHNVVMEIRGRGYSGTPEGAQKQWEDDQRQIEGLVNGFGRLTIRELRFRPPESGNRESIEWMKFSIELRLRK